jgi:23S rRNA (cytosine1962-C5)-methyltransferase
MDKKNRPAERPAPASASIALRVTPAAERALRRGHPWLFAEAITSQSRPGQSGELAVVFDDRRRFLAIGLYDPDGPIRVRLLQHGQPATIDRDWLIGRLEAAIARRAPLWPRVTPPPFALFTARMTVCRAW